LLSFVEKAADAVVDVLEGSEGGVKKPVLMQTSTSSNASLSATLQEANRAAPTSMMSAAPKFGIGRGGEGDGDNASASGNSSSSSSSSSGGVGGGGGGRASSGSLQQKSLSSRVFGVFGGAISSVAEAATDKIEDVAEEFASPTTGPLTLAERLEEAKLVSGLSSAAGAVGDAGVAPLKETPTARREREREERKKLQALRRQQRSKKAAGHSLASLVRERKAEAAAEAAGGADDEVAAMEREAARKGSRGKAKAKVDDMTLEDLLNSVEVVKSVKAVAPKMNSHIKGAFENVGRSAFAFLAEQIRAIERGGNGASSGGSDASSKQGAAAAAGPPTFGRWFETFLGQSHLDALQLLSSSTSSEAAAAGRKISGPKLKMIGKKSAKLKAILTIDGDDEGDGDGDGDGGDSGAVEAMVGALKKLSSAGTKLSTEKLEAAVKDADAIVERVTAGGSAKRPTKKEPRGGNERAGGGGGGGRAVGDDAGGDGRGGEGEGERGSGGSGGPAATNGEIHAAYLEAMAEVVSAYVEICRKAAEMVIIEAASSDQSAKGLYSQAPALRQATVQLTEYLANFAEAVDGLLENGPQVNDGVSTAVFLDQSTATQQVEMALSLLHPIFQLSLFQ
jgi:hypothetical protein